MSRITIQIAKDITTALLSKKHNEYEGVRLEYKGLIENHILANTPVKILEIFNDSSLKRYLKTDQSISISGPGIKHAYETLTNTVPTKGSGIELPKELASKVEKLIQKSDKMWNEIKELRNEINASLLALGTFKRVQEQFPEAAQFLPKTSVSTSLVVNVSKLREKINA